MNGVHSTSTGTRLLFADSTNRDYPSGNSYVLHLTSPVKNVERVDPRHSIDSVHLCDLDESRLQTTAPTGD